MIFLNTLSIRYKIMSISAVAILGFGGYFSLNYSVAQKNLLQLEKMRTVVLPSLTLSEKNLVRLDKIVSQLDQAISTQEPDLMDAVDIKMKEMQSAFNQIIKLDPSQVDKIKTLQDMASEYYALAKRLTLGMLKGTLSLKETPALASNMKNTLEIFRQKLDQYRDQQQKLYNNAIESTNHSMQNSIQQGMLIGIALIIILAATGYFVATGITRSIVGVSNNLKEISSGHGDLTQRIHTTNEDEVGQLVEHFNTFMTKMQGIMQELRNYTNDVSGEVQQLTRIAEEGLNSMEKQRVETEQVATASNQMAVTVSEVARNAEQAADAANSASLAAGNGRTIVDETISIINQLASDVEKGVTAVNQLREESQSVGSVLDVIRGIAEQTNLLALNAAIEAARAGEQGRGFAVVADEVRTLASRTQESTQEIQTMIESLQSNAGQAADIMGHGRKTSEQGVDKVAEAGNALTSITKAVTVISDMNAQIASASEQQSAVATEMDKNITNISHATEAKIEDSNKLTQSGNSLNKVAIQLQELVGQFKV